MRDVDSGTYLFFIEVFTLVYKFHRTTSLPSRDARPMYASTGRQSTCQPLTLIALDLRSGSLPFSEWPSTASPGAEVQTFTGKPGWGRGKQRQAFLLHSLPPDLPTRSILSAYTAQADRPILQHQYVGPHAQSYGRACGGLSVNR
jgi:hypothetical protein